MKCILADEKQKRKPLHIPKDIICLLSKFYGDFISSFFLWGAHVSAKDMRVSYILHFNELKQKAGRGNDDILEWERLDNNNFHNACRFGYFSFAL